jgi:hypothetical protein
MGAHENIYDNNTAPTFIGLHKTTQKHASRKRKMARKRITSYGLKQMHFNVNNDNAIALKYEGSSKSFRFFILQLYFTDDCKKKIYSGGTK